VSRLRAKSTVCAQGWCGGCARNEQDASGPAAD
jgi:hypothetical protein